MKHRLCSGLAQALLGITALQLAPLPACAQAQPGGPGIVLSGFGTVGFSSANTDEVYYTQPYRPDEVDRSGDAGLDSKLALQASYKLKPSLTAVLQVIAKHTVEDNFEPSPEWVFARWDIDQQRSLRVGRIGAPFFMNSDARDINYVQLTARPPFDVYGQVPVSHFDGADLTYRANVGETMLTASAWGGRSTAKVTDVSTQGAGVSISRVNLQRLLGLTLSAALDNGTTLRAGVARANITLDTGDSDIGPGLTPAQTRDVLDTLNTRHEPITFSGLGASHEQGPWLVNAEYTWLRSSTQIADTTGWYLNAGYRIRSVTPYIGLSKIRVTDLNRGNPLRAFLGQPTVAGVVADQVQSYLKGGNVAQRTVTVGARWDVVDKVALKLQWDRISKPSRSFGAFRPRPGDDEAAVQGFYDGRRRIDVLSLNLDFVF